MLVSHVDFPMALGRLTPPCMHPTCVMGVVTGARLGQPRRSSILLGAPRAAVPDDGSANAMANGWPVYAGHVRQQNMDGSQPCYYICTRGNYDNKTKKSCATCTNMCLNNAICCLASSLRCRDERATMHHLSLALRNTLQDLRCVHFSWFTHAIDFLRSDLEGTSAVTGHEEILLLPLGPWSHLV